MVNFERRPAVLVSACTPKSVTLTCPALRPQVRLQIGIQNMLDFVDTRGLAGFRIRAGGWRSNARRCPRREHTSSNQYAHVVLRKHRAGRQDASELIERLTHLAGVK